MSSTTGTAEQILSLPKGGGSIQGLGEKFQPDLHTGTGSYAIPLDIPNGANDIAPKLTLIYHTGAGNSAFGMGFNLNLLSISRSTDKRIPAYRADDDLVMVGVGELIDVGDGHYRSRVDPGSWRIQRIGEGFQLADRDGKYYRLGMTEQARLFTSEAGLQKVLSWHLEEIEDSLGNKVTFTYQRDANQLYLKRVDYSIYTVQFDYEERPDPIIDGHTGFLVTTNFRCRQIELLVNILSNSLTRRWELTYAQSQPGGHSLLHQVKLTGFDEAGQTASLPILTLGYTRFSPKRLERFRSERPDAIPGALPGGRRELIDWDGDGLPDLLEIGGGQARIWQNLGECTWGRPKSLASLPTPVALDEPGAAFADMEGNGTADLIVLDRPLSGYYPHLPKGGFDRPVFWRQIPSTPLSEPNARLVDLNGDRITDLLVTGAEYFSLYYRSEQGWQERPQTIPRPNVPPVSLSDPRVHLADMNGDGLQDLVRVDGAGIKYWVYLGHGRWAKPITLDNPPVLPPRFDPQRLFLNDVDGDGCADLVYVDFDKVVYWLNQGGTRLSEPQEINYTVPATINHVRLADMKGTGTSGVLWSYVGSGNRATDYFYLDFTGGVKPNLLNRIDNGMGLVTEIEYGTSTAEAIRDRQSRRPWSTFLPFSVPIVKAIRITDRTTARQTLSRYVYHEGHFDGISREFAGFGMVDVEQIGDDSTPTMLTRNWHHLGLDPEDLSKPLSEAERNRLRVFRGRLLRTEMYGLDGSPDDDKPYSRTENTWNYRVEETVNGVEILFPYLKETRSLSYERQSTPYRVTITRNLAYDVHGNVIEQEQRTEDAQNPALTRILKSFITYASNPTGRFINRPVRTVQQDENGHVVATTICYYDGLPEGQIGANGLLSRQETLVLTGETVAKVYGNTSLDFASLGYHQRPGEAGWWINQVTYTRIDDAEGLRGTVTNANGRTTQIFFDIHKIHPVKVIDALGNTITAVYDYQANKLQSVTDTNGAVISNHYDPLGRLLWTVEPGASEALPTFRYSYNTDQIPVQLVTEQRVSNGSPTAIQRRTFLDGAGQILEERVLTDEGEVAERSQLYSSQGLVKTQFLPYVPSSPDYTLPTDDLPHHRLRYDVLGRLTEVLNPDQSSQKQTFEPGIVFLFDEEDTRTDTAARHANTPIRHIYGLTGQMAEVDLNEGGRTLATRYEYDVKGNLLAVINSQGQRTELTYDLLGHRLRTISPSSGTTVFICDANGNQVETRDARGEIVRFEFDELNRLRRTFFPANGDISAIYTYDDINRPAANAGTYTKGRVVEIVHAGGREVFDYDAMGRVTRKAIYPTALPTQELVFDFTYRADGQYETITYPSPTPGVGRLQVRYEYNQRGLLSRIPGFIKQIRYNMRGQRTQIEYANGVVTTYSYDPLTLRLKDLLTADSSNLSLQEFHYEYDRVGNLLQVTSPDPKIAASYTYDDLYRLTQAVTQSGQTWAYEYDDLDNLTFKSDVGSYQYDVSGRLIRAGSETFTYTPSGQMLNTSWGDLSYDASGRLTAITRGNERMNCIYDHNGRRVRMQVISNSNAQDVLTPDNTLSIENGVIFAYIFDDEVRVAQVRLDTSRTSFLHGDHLGSTTLVTSPTGQLLQRVYYDPFGTILENTVAAEAESTRFLYTGEMWDAWSGLLYLHSRYYNPKLGRFLSADTMVSGLFNPQAWNRYSYASNNPLRFVDPTGHFFKEIGEWFEKNWKYVVAAVAIVAIAVLTVVTFGAAALIAVGIAMAIGGAIGGIAAAQAGGDVLLGVLVGMAVGGAAAFAGMGIGAGVAALGIKGLAGALISGTLSGAVSGAAMGFVSGFAGGQGSAGDIWDKMWKGALVGAAVGFAFSFAAYGFQHGWFTGPKVSIHKPTSAELGKAVEKAAAETAKKAGEQANAGTLTAGSVATEGVTNAGKELLSTVVRTGSESGYPILTPLLGQVAAPIWQAGLTTSSFLVLEYGDDLWRLLQEKEVKTPKIEGKFA